MTFMTVARSVKRAAVTAPRKKFLRLLKRIDLRVAALVTELIGPAADQVAILEVDRTWGGSFHVGSAS